MLQNIFHLSLIKFSRDRQMLPKTFQLYHMWRTQPFTKQVILINLTPLAMKSFSEEILCPCMHIKKLHLSFYLFAGGFSTRNAQSTICLKVMICVVTSNTNSKTTLWTSLEYKIMRQKPNNCFTCGLLRMIPLLHENKTPPIGPQNAL